MNIYVEDNTVGLVFWKLINIHIFKNYFNVIGFKGNRQLLKNLLNYKKNEVCICIVDKMIDEPLTKETYNKIINATKYNKNIFVPDYGCLERSMMTYNNLVSIVGDRDSAKFRFTRAIDNTIKFLQNRTKSYYINDKYSEKYRQYLRVMYTDLEMLLIITKYLETHKYWNYTLIKNCMEVGNI